MPPGWPIYRSISKRPLPHRLNQEEPRTWPSRRRGARPRSLPEVRRTRALPFARLGKKRLPCVAYGTREWFVEAVCFDLDKGDDRKRPGRRPAWREMVRAWVTRLVEANMQGAK